MFVVCLLEQCNEGSCFGDLGQNRRPWELCFGPYCDELELSKEGLLFTQHLERCNLKLHRQSEYDLLKPDWVKSLTEIGVSQDLTRKAKLFRLPYVRELCVSDQGLDVAEPLNVLLSDMVSE